MLKIFLVLFFYDYAVSSIVELHNTFFFFGLIFTVWFLFSIYKFYQDKNLIQVTLNLISLFPFLILYFYIVLNSFYFSSLELNFEEDLIYESISYEENPITTYFSNSSGNSTSSSNISSKDDDENKIRLTSEQKIISFSRWNY